MKKYILRSAYGLVVLALGVQGCKPTIDAPSPSAGSVDFSNYVSVGNSLTAGYSNNGLYTAGQLNSYPSILFKAMQATGAGPASFNQPLFPDGSAGSGYLTFQGFLAPGVPNLVPVPADASQILRIENTTALGPTPVFRDIANGMSLHNLGVPGIRVADIANPFYGVPNSVGFNPYFARMLPDSLSTLSGSLPYLLYVAKRKPTFFTNWLGNNDVLGYASAGAASGELTPLAIFQANYSGMLDSLMRTAKKGLLATIPDVTSTPFFTTIPQAPIVLDATKAQALQYGYSVGPTSYNSGIKYLNSLLPAGAPKFDTARFVAGANVPMIYDPNPMLNLVKNMRPLRPAAGERILLVASDSLSKGQGSLRPLENKYVLDSTELKNIQQATDDFNDFIRSQANTRGLALFDAQVFLRQVKAGTVFFDGVQITSSFISGGAFSLDGVHPTSRGYALIANEMMKAINAKYGTSLSPVNAVDYPAVTFPK